MCGYILGLTGFQSELNTDALIRGLQLIEHRGPDSSAHVLVRKSQSQLFFGHNRLSIIDLEERSAQPMTAHGFTLIFNGEIFNYREIRESLAKEGYGFQTNGDTEVLLQAWRAWGERCLLMLKGMFSFAIYDDRKDEVALVRDAFGIKPLYVSTRGHYLYAASEIKAILAAREEPSYLNEKIASEYLLLGLYGNRKETFFAGIESLEPGHILYATMDGQGRLSTKKKRWWVPDKEKYEGIDFNQATEICRQKVLYAMDISMRSDVPISLSLSGGLDSTIIASAVRELYPNISLTGFCYGSEDQSRNEMHWASRVGGYLDIDIRNVSVSQEDIKTHLAELIRLQEEPFGSASIFAQYSIYKASSQSGFKVNLEGQGADELFAGYNGYPEAVMWEHLRDGNILNAIDHITHQSNTYQSRVRKLASLAASMYSPNASRWLKALMANIKFGWLRDIRSIDFLELLHDTLEQPPRSLSETLEKSLTKEGLPKLLRTSDRSSMSFSMEARVPFLDIELAELCLSLPYSYHIDAQGTTKRLLRESMRGIAPDFVIERSDKIGFEVPDHLLLSRLPHLIEKVKKESKDIPLLDGKGCHKLLENAVTRPKRNNWTAWRLINYVEWYREMGLNVK